MKKKIVAMCATVAIAALAVGGTMAYFQDQTEVAKNVMKTGDVAIEQYEQERDANGALTVYDADNNNKLLPYAGTVNAKGEAAEYTETVTVNGEEYEMFSQADNAIDKIVTVKNTGSEDAYVRTLFAFEMVEVEGELVNPFDYETCGEGQYLYTVAKKDAKGYGMALCTNGDDFVTFTLGEGEDAVTYCVAQYDYGMVEAGAVAGPSLLGLYLNANAGNEWAGMIGEDGEYNVLVLTQAVQVEGFENENENDLYGAFTALNTAFGAVDGSFGEIVDDGTLIDWFEDLA